MYSASITVVRVAIGIYRFELTWNIYINPKVGTVGVLDNLADGEKYSEHFLGKFVYNKSPKIMPSLTPNLQPLNSLAPIKALVVMARNIGGAPKLFDKMLDKGASLPLDFGGNMYLVAHVLEINVLMKIDHVGYVRQAFQARSLSIFLKFLKVIY